MNPNEQKGKNILLLLEILEYYIEKLEVYANFQKKQQLRNRITPEPTLQKCSLENLESTFSSQLLIFLGLVCDTKNPPRSYEELRKEEQAVFHQWIGHSGITAENCPEKLKHFLLEIEDILEKQSLKIYKDNEAYLWRKKKEDPISPQESAKALKELDRMMANPPKLYLVDMKGDAEEGKKVLDQIANSLTPEERENFHFYLPFTNEEKTEHEKEKKEGNPDSITKGQRINAIEEIKNALQREPRRLTNNDLDPENQDWEAEINRTEGIIEIENVKRRVLADIERKKCQGCQELNKKLAEKKDKIKQLEQEIAELKTKVSQAPENPVHKANLFQKESELAQVQEELKQLISPSLPTPTQNQKTNSPTGTPWPWILGIGGGVILLVIFGTVIYWKKKRKK